MITKKPLPVDDLLPEISKRLSAGSNLILKATPGSGKTTRVPPFLLSLCKGEVLVLEPRRIAARMSAARVAQERGEPLGETVGYKVRFDSQIGRNTRLVFLTEGLLVRRLLSDPDLKGVDFVVLDEFHERHLHTDVALSFLRHLQRTSRPDLKLVVMSATLDTRALEGYLGVSESLELKTLLHPIEVKFAERPLAKPLPFEVAAAVQRALRREGDILVFLPGRREIQGTLEALGEPPGVSVLPLYGELPMDQQVKVLEPIPNRRRVILSTNIAETSLTIEGVRQVIDSGLHRQARMSAWSGVPVLETRSVSRSSAEQRKGRAGRLGPGYCERLYTQADFNGRLEFEVPEIQRADLSATVLELLSLGWNLEQPFPWFDPPKESSWNSAIRLLSDLGAIKEGRISELGREIVKLPISPRLAAVLLQPEGWSEELLDLVSQLSEGEVESQDVREAAGRRLNARAERVRQSLAVLLKPDRRKPKVEMGRCFLAGFGDRVGRVRKADTQFASVTLSSGGSVDLPRGSLKAAVGDLFLVLEAQESRSGAGVHNRASVLLPVSEDMILSSPNCRTISELKWESGKLKKSTGLYYGELALMEDREALTQEDYPAAFEVFLRYGLGISTEDLKSQGKVLEVLGRVFNTEGLKSELARIKVGLEAGAIGGWEFNPLDPQIWLRLALMGCETLEDFKNRNWLEAWTQSLNWDTAQKIKSELEKRVPTTITLGRRKSCPVHYEFDKAPWIESRIQDFFGLKDGPRVLNGKMPLTLHLLAPNYRAVQVTSDLTGFWQRHYETVRQELKRRYPRHKWPEDPLKPFDDDNKN